MTFEKLKELFDWLPEGERPQQNSSHTMLMMIDSEMRCSEVCLTLADEDVKYTCGLADDGIFEVEVQV